MRAAVAPRVALALLGALIALSFAAPLFRLAAPTHPLVAAGLRLSLAALILSPLIVRAHRAGRLDRLTVRLALLAGLAYGLHFGAWVTSLTLTSVAASVTLVTCTPLLLGVWAAITGEDRQGGVFFVALGCSSLGLVIIGGADLASEGALVGDALALLGALAIAGYFLLARRLGPTLDVGAFSAIATATGGLALLTAAAFMGIELRPASVSAAWAIALCTLIPQLIGHTLLTWSLRHVGPSVTAMATVGEPVGATLLSDVLLGESVSPSVFLGCACTLAGVMVVVLSTGRERGLKDAQDNGKLS